MAFWSARTELCDQHKTDQLSSSSLLLSLLSTLVLFAWSMMGHAQWHANLPAPDTAHFRSPPALPATTLKLPQPSTPDIFIVWDYLPQYTPRRLLNVSARTRMRTRDFFSDFCSQCQDPTPTSGLRLPVGPGRICDGGRVVIPSEGWSTKYRRLLFQPYADLFPSARKLSHLHPQLPRWLRWKFMISPFD